MRWTQAQQRTIDTRDKNILVSAAAGSGKTTVLIERIKQLVLGDRVDIDRFLITTFTKAAATEMKEKMEKAIHGEMQRLREEQAAAEAKTTAEAQADAEAHANAEAQNSPSPTGSSDSAEACKKRSEQMAYLQRQMDLLPQAGISTFHTFCMGIMRDFFYLTDLQPGFTVGDETRLAILLREACDDSFESRFEEDTERFRRFLRKYSGDRNDDRLKENLLKVYKEMLSIPRYMDWASDRIRRMKGDDPVEALGIGRFIMEETVEAVGDAIQWYDAAVQMLDHEETSSLCMKARKDVENLELIRSAALQALAGVYGAAGASGDDGLSANAGASEGAGASAGTEASEEMGASRGTEASGSEEAFLRMKEALENFKATRMVAAKAEKARYETVKKQVSDLREKGKKCLDGLRRKYYAQSLEECRRILRESAEDTAYYVGLIAEIEQRYREKKQAQNLVDFDEIMHYTLRILEDADAAAEYRERFRYIFIDEYQDSNLLQEEIIGRIARDNNLFMVGDVKQSIYKFRLAEPEIFRDRYEAYRSGSDENSVRIDLNSNFRSRGTIRDAVNRIFERIMPGYDEDARLNGPEEESDRGYPVCLHILNAAPEEVGPGLTAGSAPASGSSDAQQADPSGGLVGEAAGSAPASGSSDAQQADLSGGPVDELTEPAIIAGIIRDCIGKPVTDRDGSVRPIGYGDIAVLSRGGAAIPQIERYLNNEGIPAFGETAGGYYETVEIQVFLNLLRIISNLRQDVPLISVMSSVIFDFPPRQLAQIRIECREGSFCDAVRWYGSEGRDLQIREKIGSMLDQILLWRELGRTLPLDELMRTLLYETGYYDYCSGLPVGQQRTSNLRLLLEKAAAYEETSYHGLYGFLAYVDAMRRSNQKVGEASLAGEGQDTVHVMTVHKSKGLEFPVVILAGAGRRITGSTEGRAPAMHKAHGIGLPEVDREHHWERKTILQKTIAGRKNREDLEEEIRILYVALTRPMQRLEIVGTTGDAAKLQQFPGKGSFLQMIYGTLCEMAEEDPASARVVIHRHGEVSPEEAAGETAPAVPEEERASAGASVTLPEEDARSEDADSLPEENSRRAADEMSDTEAKTSAGGGAAADPVPDPAADPAGIRRRLAWTYPYAEESTVKTKYSVTELARREAAGGAEPAPEIPELRMPQAGAEAEEAAQRLSPAQAGTVMHTIMERIDFAAAADQGLPYIRTFTEELCERGFLTEAERDCAEPEDIAAFFGTGVGRRAAGADFLCREKEFLLRREVDGVPAIVQGVIDCYFEDAEGLVLIDYKNSWAGDEAQEQEVIRRYAPQIRLYRQALELALGRTVDEAWLYLFRSRRFVQVPEEEPSEKGGTGSREDL